MAGFTESALSKKLEDLNSSQQSIQTLSLWLIHHRKHFSTIVKTWTRELISAEEPRQLTLMYLANDVIQNSRKKGPEYGREFGSVLKKAFEIMGGDACSEKTQKSMERLLNIWEERGIYDKKTIEEYKKALGSQRKIEPPQKRKSKSKETNVKKRKEGSSHKTNHEEYKIESKTNGTSVNKTNKSTTNNNKTSEPEPEGLIKALTELENSASSDAVVREKIASFPPEVSDMSLLSKLKDKRAAVSLLKQVNEAVKLLEEYNSRLINEMGDRKKATTLLKDFIQAQRTRLEQTESRVVEYKEKLRRICAVRQELKSRLQSLPQLPDVTGALTPLPSAGDLFTIG